MNGKNIFIALFVLTCSFQVLSAQAYKNSFVIICEKFEERSIIKTFTGFNSNAIGQEENFTTVVYFRGLIGKPHKGQIVIEKPNGEVRKGKAFSFILESKLSQHRQITDWENVYLPVKGTYAIKVYIDDRLDSTVYFDVGD